MRSTFSLITAFLFLAVSSFAQDSTKVNHHGMDLSNPQSTLRAFFTTFKTWDVGGKNNASFLFDLSKEERVSREQEAEFKIQLMKKSLDRIEKISYDSIPSDNSKKSYTLKSFPQGSFTLIRNANSEYVFDKATLLTVEDVFQSLASKEQLDGIVKVEGNLALDLRTWMAQYPILMDTTLYVKNWHWLLLLPLLFFSSVIYALCALFGQGLIRKMFRRKGKPISNLNLGKPLGVVLSSFVFYSLLKTLLVYEDNLFFKILTITVHVLYSYSLVWFLWQMVNWMTIILEERAEQTESKFDDLLVPMLRTSLRILIVIVGIFLGANVFQYDISHLLAGLGIGSLAFALAAKDTIENLFGSITVIADRPFHIGDWVLIDGTEGTVEKLGFRSTRLRTFYDSQISVPNSKLINAIVDNMGQRKFRRIKTTLGVTYGTSTDKVQQFCEGIRDLIRNHPYTRKDYYHVYFNNFGPSSLDIMLYCFVEVPDWAVELRERERLFLDILRLAENLGVEFAFPTQSLFLTQQDPIIPDPSSMEQAKSTASHLSATHFDNGQRPGGVNY